MNFETKKISNTGKWKNWNLSTSLLTSCLELVYTSLNLSGRGGSVVKVRKLV